MSNITAEDVKRVKDMGFLKNRNCEGAFSVRVLTKNGVLTSQQVRSLVDLSEKWGNGKISFTSRLAVEIPQIAYEDIDTVKQFVEDNGMMTGGTGRRIRPILACKGTTCHFGNADTQGVAQRIHDRFYMDYYDAKLPHKFKIAVGGCPNNCVKPDLNDFGLVGVHIKEFNEDLCRGCKKCAIEMNCPMGAPSVIDGKMVIDKDICNDCGRCVGKCYFKAMNEGKRAFKIYIGGRWGKKIRHASMMPGVYDEEQAMDILEKTLLLFKLWGESGERLASLLDRVGTETFFNALETENLLERKNEILGR